jgi:serine protease Do
MLVPQLKTGKVTRSYLGMNITDVSEETREAFDLPEARGALVQAVEEGKPAARAGIRHGDVIVEIDGKPIRNNRELIDYISYRPVGSEVRITLYRNGQRQTVTAKTAQRPAEGGDEEETTPSATEPVRDKLGLTVTNITATLRSQYNLGEELRGVVVTDVKNVSPAGEANISEGDVISEVQGQRVNTVEEFRAAVDKLRSGQRVRMYVTSTPSRGGGEPISTYRIVTVP